MTSSPRPVVGVGAVVLDGDRVLLIRRGQPPLKGEWSNGVWKGTLDRVEIHSIVVFHQR